MSFWRKTSSASKQGKAPDESNTEMIKETQFNPEQMASAAAEASELMRTLGHRDRLMVLCHLISGEKSVGELAGLLEIPQSPLSQHLARMRKEDLVTTRREAQTIYYSIASSEATRMVELMHELYCSETRVRLTG
jgi:DNA-binding transcriptional ArsR family regulator